MLFINNNPRTQNKRLHFPQLTAAAVLVSMLMSGCGTSDLPGASSEQPVDSIAAVSEGDAAAGADEVRSNALATESADSAASQELTQTITIKADASGNPQSAVIKQSDDDMEESVGREEIEALPFAVKVRYYLNGQETSPEKLAGQTGHVRIRFDYENNSQVKQTVDGQEIDTIVPYAFLSMIILPEDRFSGITVTNGSATEMQDNQIAFGYAMPGIKDALKLDAVDTALDDLSFEFDDDDDDKSTGSDKDSKKSESDKDSSKSDSGKDSSKSDSGKDSSKSDSDKGSDKSDADQDSIKADPGDKDTKETGSGTDSRIAVAEQAKTGSEEEPADDEEDELLPDYIEIEADVQNFKLDFTATVVTNGLLADTKDDTITDLQDVISDLKDFGEAGDDLQDGTKKLQDGAGEFRDGLSQYISGAGSLVSGTSQLNSGAAKLTENSSALKEGAAQLSNGLAELNKAVADAGGASSSAAGIDVEALVQSAASAAAEAAMGQLAANEALSDEEKAAAAQAAGTAAAMAAASDLQSAVSGAADSGSGQLTELQNGISALAECASSLQQGVNAYTDGVDQLAEGVKKLADGAGQFSSAGSKVLSGYDELKKGIGKLADGVREFNEDGMQKIGELAGHELTDSLNRYRAMILADQGHTALNVFDGNDGEIRYILETAEVK